MALPENGFRDDYILEPSDLTPELMMDFARYCRTTEADMLKEVFLQSIPIVQSPVSRSEEEDIFASIFKQDL